MGLGLDAARLVTATVLPPAAGSAAGSAAWTAASPELRARAVALAGDARVDLLLASSLHAHGVEPPADLAARAAQAKAAAAWSWVEGGAILDALERGGLTPIVLKGGDLSARAYPVVFAALHDRAYLRHATDLDVLLANPEAAAPVMRKEGFVPDVQGAAHHVRWKKEGAGLAFSVELHDDLFDRPHGLRLALDEMRASAVTVASPDGGSRRVLAPVDAFLHVAGHAVQSDLLRDPVSAVRGPIDLAVLVRAAPVQSTLLLRKAIESGLAGAAGIAVHWAEEVGAGLPKEIEIIGRAMFGLGGTRFAFGKRRLLRNAHAAVEGGAFPRGPATAWRALLAPSLVSAAAMLLEGARRRTRPR